MRFLSIFLFCVFFSNLKAQSNQNKNIINRKGFTIGLGLGAGMLSLKVADTNQTAFSTTLPNIKIGAMINKHFALLVMLPGANYKYYNKDRGFEAFTISGQYWAKERLWILAGMGLTFDAPAFYTVKDPKTAEFYTGFPAITAATGYEIWQGKNFALDVQYRFFVGQSNLSNSQKRQGMSNMFILGINWY